MTVGWEQALIAGYRRHLVVALPLTIVVIKLLVRVISREPKKDVFRSVLVVPLDFVYVAIGILLAAAARRDASLIARYGSDVDADMAVVVQVIALVAAATIITLCDRGTRILWGKFFAAWKLFGEAQSRTAAATTGAEGAAPGQMNLNLASENASTMSKESGILLVWILFYWTGMVPLVMAQIALGVLCLGSILDRLQ